jgi:hypothetical protein
MNSVHDSNKLGRGVMTWRKLLTAMTALAAMLVIMTASPPSYARELQRLETATPEQVGMSGARLERITEALKKEVSDGKLPGVVVIVARKGKSSIRVRPDSRTRARTSP